MFRMKSLLLIIFCFPVLLFSQFENRTHILGGANLQVSTNSYQLYDSFIFGGETILGLRFGKVFAGVGIGALYTGSDYLILLDDLGNEIEKVTLYNIDVPIFLDITYGKKFYMETKLGYAVKLGNIQEYQNIETHTLFNSLGFAYSIPVSKKVYIDIALEGKFNYLFTNSISQNYTSIYFMPIAKLGFRFVKTLD